MRDIRRRTDLYWKIPLGLLLALVFLGLPVLAAVFLFYQVRHFAPPPAAPASPSRIFEPHPTAPLPPEPPVSDKLETLLLQEDARATRVSCGPVTAEKPPSLHLLKDLGRHDGRACSALFSPDARRVLSAGADGTVRLWDVAGGKELARLEGHRGTVWAAVFAGTAGRAASAGADGTLRLWDLERGKELCHVKAHDGPLFALAVSPDGATLYSGGRSVCAWEATGGKRIAEYPGAPADVLSLAVSPDGKHLLGGCADGSAVTWDLKTGRPLRRMRLGQRVNAVRFLPDGRHALLGGDWSCCYWNVLAGERLVGPHGSPIPIRSAAVLRRGRYALTGTERGWLLLCNLPVQPVGFKPHDLLASLTLTSVTDAHAGTIHAVDTSADDTRAVTAGADGRIRLWQVDAPPRLQVRGLSITALAVDPAGRYAVCGEQDGRLVCWDLRRGEAVRTLSPHNGAIEAVAFSHDGKRLFSSSPGICHFEDMVSGEEVLAFDKEARWVRRAVISPDEKWVGCEAASEVCALSLQTRKKAWQTWPHNTSIVGMAFLPDGRLFYADHHGKFFVREIATGELIRTYRLSEADGIHACVLSRDGRRMWLATWTKEQGHAVSGWDLEAKREVMRFTGLPGGVGHLVLSPDGRSLAGAGGHHVHVWGLDPPRSRWHVQSWQFVSAIVFLPDGRQVLVAYNKGGLGRWDLPAEK